LKGTLENIRILDLSRVLAGPWATQLLGDYGADVIKVERPGGGDDTRQWGPPWLNSDDAGESAYFLSTNRNKRSITVDLKTEQGCELIRALAAQADVLVENFKTGSMAKFGLDAATLQALNPRLVYCSISAYGQNNSRSAEPGYDAMMQARGGLMSITGAPDAEGGSPQKVGVAIADIMAGMYAATAILAALNARQVTGAGEYIDVPLYASQVAWLANQGMNYLIGGKVPQRLGTAHPNLVPYQVFPTRDGHLMLAVGNDRQFSDCCKVLGVEELASDQRFRCNADRVAHRDSLVELLAAALRQADTGHWLQSLADATVPAGPVNDIETVFTDDFAEETGLVRHMAHPDSESLPSIANPVTFSANKVSYRQAPPRLSEHTREVLSEWLGYDDCTVDKLQRAGVI
jgi:crotonobetainyl-CoA:carnitine CoA-transferase CaiB-like acyl-CoA transferase